MLFVRALFHSFAPPMDDLELMQAQATAFARQVPLLYSILIVNAAALVVSYWGLAPHILTLYVPAVLFCLCIVRLLAWRGTRASAITPEKARRLLTATLITAGPMALGFALWSLALLPYGDAYRKAHVAFFIGVTTIGIVCCLMHLRAAALIVTVIALTPFVTVFALSGNAVLLSIALNTVLVMIALLFVLGVNYRHFAELVSSKRTLLREREEINKLSLANARLADTDPLTGLPNRRRFFRELEDSLPAIADASGALLVARIDLDGFKGVNDVFGHAAGDAVLVQVGDRLNQVIGEGALVARLGGDEFGILSHVPPEGTDLDALGSALSSAMKRPFQLSGAVATISGSIGFALSQAGDNSTDVHDRADHAAYVAKQGAKGGHVVFSVEHEAELKRARSIELALASCDFDEAIELAFQPIFNITTQSVVSYELLARWNNSPLGAVSPAEFIPAAERTGAITEITCSILRRALVVAEELPDDVNLSVNLSANDICSEDSVRRIEDILGKGRTDKAKIDFEITETALLRDIARAKAAIASLSALGARFALDDFGVGYSSLSSIKELQIQCVKLDRSFIAEVSTDKRSQAIVRSTISLCHELGMDCVVEGIETVEQMEALHLLGARRMQGYLFERPMTLQALLERNMVLQSRSESSRNQYA